MLWPKCSFHQFILKYKLFCHHFGAASQPCPGKEKLLGRSPLGHDHLGTPKSFPVSPSAPSWLVLTSQFSSAGRGLRGYFISSHKLFFKLLSGCHIWFCVHHATISDFFFFFLFSPFRHNFHILKNIFLPPVASFNLPFNHNLFSFLKLIR